MRRAVASLALMAAAVPAAAQETPQQLYKEGVAARQAGEHARAIGLLGRAVAAEPGNADARLQLGLALMGANRLDEAEAELRRTLELAPAYDDARIALARLERRRGRPEAARRELDRANPANAEVAELRSQLDSGSAEPSRYRTQVNLDSSYSALDGASDWREAALSVRHDASRRTAVAAQLEASRRFGLDDLYGEIRLDRRAGTGSNVYLSIGGTPEADFRPRWQIGAGGALRVRAGPSATVLTVDARQARYRSGDIQTVTPGLEQYLAGGRFWLTGRLINIFDETGDHHLGWLARGDVQASPRIRFFAGLADAPDTSAGAVIDTFSLFGGASLDLDDRTSLRISAAREDRELGADRLQLGLGLGYRF